MEPILQSRERSAQLSSGASIAFRAIVLAVAAATAFAAPPGASVRTKLQVPDSLHNGTFGSDRFLNIPPGFQISLLARVDGARFLAVAPNGDIFVSQPGAGRVTLLRPNPAGGVPRSFTYASGLRRPHDIVFHTSKGLQYVYISETKQVNRYRYSPGDTAARDRQVVVANMPDSSTPELGGAYGHELKNFALSDDDRLYVSIASTCNVCTSDTVSNPVRAAVYQYNADGTSGRLFASGLRNAEGVRFVPGTNSLWVVVNNRDEIPYPLQDSTGNYGRVMASYVDNHPPDLFTSVRDGGNYGWPFCNSNPDRGFDAMPFEKDFDINKDGHVDCGKMDVPVKGIQAHSAPLGLSFLGDTAFAAPYRNGAVVGLHGSWNRSTPTGYKVIYFPWNAGTQTPEEQIDLVTGFLDEGAKSAWGRPVAAVADTTGSLLISDDQAGAIYKLTYTPAAISAASGVALLAPGSIGMIRGTNLTTETAAASSADWPTSLGGATITVQDSAGAMRQARIAYASPAQLNFEIPAGTATGTASVTLQSTMGVSNLGTIFVTATAPALFTANGNGQGVAAATAVQVALPSSNQSPLPVFSCDQPGNCKSVPIPLGSDTPVYVSLFGTGIRGRASLANVTVTINKIAVPILYAGSQGTYPGLDQVNVSIPLSLRGAGEVDVVLTIDGVASNAARIAIQ